MTTEIFTVGEAIYIQGEKKDFMVYVLRGTIQILSAEDGESRILTLGVGTCLGEINLMYSFPSPVQVIDEFSFLAVLCLEKGISLIQ